MNHCTRPLSPAPLRRGALRTDPAPTPDAGDPGETATVLSWLRQLSRRDSAPLARRIDELSRRLLAGAAVAPAMLDPHKRFVAAVFLLYADTLRLTPRELAHLVSTPAWLREGGSALRLLTLLRPPETPDSAEERATSAEPSCAASPATRRFGCITKNGAWHRFSLC